MSNVFITGGAGLIGAHTARLLLDLGHAVTVYDSYQQYVTPPGSTFLENMRYRHEKLLDGAEIVRGSTEDKDRLRRQLVAAGAEYVIHLAALPLANVAAHAPEEALRSIVQGVVNTLDVVRDLPGVTKFVYASSSMVYGNFTRIPMPEDGRKEPVEVYGAMKLSGEVLVRAYGRLYGIPYVIVRPSAVYGPSDINRRVVQALVELAVEDEPVVVNNPDTTFLDFTYVTDIACGLVAAALTPDAVADEFNITYGAGRSLTELVRILYEHFPNLKVDVRNREHDLRPARGTLDVSKARRLVGFRPEVRLEEGVARYIDYVRTYNASIAKNR